MVDSSKIRWGIISTANIAKTAVIPAIKQSRNGVVTAVASRDLSRARAYADELGIERAYGSYEELLADPNIDAIYNPLPNDGHAPWSIAAAKAKKPTLCEKPLARTTEEAQQIVDAFQQEKVLLAEAFMYRYHLQHGMIQKLIDEGSIGTVNLLDATFTYSLSPQDRSNVRLNAALGGGGLLDVGCYCVNACRMFAKQEPESVTGQVIYGESGVDEVFVGTLKFPNGILARFACGMRSMDENTYTITGTRGHITANAAYRPNDGGETTITMTRPDTAAPWRKTDVITVPACNQYTLMVEDFGDAVAQKRLTTYDPVDSLNNMRVLDALARAARDNVVVKL